MDYPANFNALMVTKRKALSAVRSSTKSSLKDSGTSSIGDKAKDAIVSIICNYTKGYLLNGFHPKLPHPPGKNGTNGLTLGSNGISLHKEPFLKYMRSLEKVNNVDAKPIKKAKKRVSFGPSTVKIFSENDYFKGEKAMLNEIAKKERCRPIHDALRKRTKDQPLIISGRRSSFYSAKTQIKKQVKPCKKKKKPVIASKVKKIPIVVSTAKKPCVTKKAEENKSGICKDKSCVKKTSFNSESSKVNSGTRSKIENCGKESKKESSVKKSKEAKSVNESKKGNESKKLNASGESKKINSGDNARKQNAGTKPKKLNTGKKLSISSSGNASKKNNPVNGPKQAKCGRKNVSKKIDSKNNLMKGKPLNGFKTLTYRNTNKIIKITPSCALKLLAKVSGESCRSFSISTKHSSNFPCLFKDGSGHYKILTGCQGRPFSVSSSDLKIYKIAINKSEEKSIKKDNNSKQSKNCVGRPRKTNTKNKMCSETFTGTNGGPQKKSNNATVLSKETSGGASSVKATVKLNSSLKETGSALKNPKEDHSEDPKKSHSIPSESSKKNVDKHSKSHPSLPMEISKRTETCPPTKNDESKRPHGLGSENNKGDKTPPKKMTKPTSSTNVNTSPRREAICRTRRKMLLRHPEHLTKKPKTAVHAKKEGGGPKKITSHNHPAKSCVKSYKEGKRKDLLCKLVKKGKQTKEHKLLRQIKTDLKNKKKK